MHRFFIEDIELKINSTNVLPNEITRQIVNVLRAKTGDRMILLDNSGMEFLVEINIESKKKVTFTVIKEMKNNSESKKNVTLYQSLLKSQDRFELVIQKCTEIGIKHFRPLITEYCQVDKLRKTERVHRIIKEATEQSQRGKLPTLSSPIKLNKLLTKLSTNSTTTNLFFYEGLRNDKMELPILNNEINLIIGPEGGFSEKENHAIMQFCESNMNSHILTLGKRILRSETASIVASATVLSPFI